MTLLHNRYVIKRLSFFAFEAQVGLFGRAFQIFLPLSCDIGFVRMKRLRNKYPTVYDQMVRQNFPVNMNMIKIKIF